MSSEETGRLILQGNASGSILRLFGVLNKKSKHFKSDRVNFKVNAIRKARALIVLVIGGTALVLGAIMLAIPGPGLAVIAAGLAIMATEFAWARKLLRKVKKKISKKT